MFQKIGAIIEFIFAAAIGIACGLVCYYYVWLSSWSMVAKVFAMIGFCVWAVVAMFWPIMFGAFMLDDFVELDKENVEFAIIAMILAFFIPGLIYLIDLFVDGRSSKHSKYEPSSNTGVTYTVPKVKKRVEKYNPDDDPAIIKKPVETRTPKGAPSGSATPAKKKMVK